jgi:hypothetical protein
VEFEPFEPNPFSPLDQTGTLGARTAKFVPGRVRALVGVLGEASHAAAPELVGDTDGRYPF